MKKLKDKHAILCKNKEEAIAIRDMFGLDLSNQAIYRGFNKYKIIVLYSHGSYSSLKYANESDKKILKASKIIKPTKSGELENIKQRLDKLEKHLPDNTEVICSAVNMDTFFITEQPKELTELPEDWHIVITEENRLSVKKWFKSENCYSLGAFYGIKNGEKTSKRFKEDIFGLEITFDQFKKWVSKEDDLTPVKIPNIREVQVKVSTQEEAEECARIAVECGESVNKELDFKEQFKYFRLRISRECFGFFGKSIDAEIQEITFQQFKEYYSKPKEVDWSKAGQLVENNDGLIVFTNGIHYEKCFTGIVLKGNKYWGKNTNKSNWSKDCFKLCTQPITISNE